MIQTGKWRFGDNNDIQEVRNYLPEPHPKSYHENTIKALKPLRTLPMMLGLFYTIVEPNKLIKNDIITFERILCLTEEGVSFYAWRCLEDGCIYL